MFSFSRTNLKLRNIHVAPKLVKKVISNLDLFKTSGLDFNPVVVLKSFESELSYLEQILFPDCWRVSSLFSAFRNVERKSMAKSYRPICLLSVVSKILGKILNNRLVDHLEKYDLSLFQRLIL